MLAIFSNFRRLPRDVHYNTFMWALQAFGYFGIFGVLFNIYLLRLGYGTETIGLMVGAGQLAWGIGAIPAGMIGRRVGNRDPALWGIAVIAITTVLLLLVEFVPSSWQTAWIAAWWIVCWLGVALQTVNTTPYVMSVCAPEERSTAFTAQMLAQGVGAFTGSLVAGVLPGYIAKITGTGLDSPTPYWIALWIAPLFYFGAFWVFSHSHRVAPLATTSTTHNGSKTPFFLISFIALLVLLQTLGEGVVRSFYNVYLDTALFVPITQIGLVMGLAQALPLFATVAAPGILARWGTGGTIIVTGGVMAFFLLFWHSSLLPSQQRVATSASCSFYQPRVLLVPYSGKRLLHQNGEQAHQPRMRLGFH